MNNVRIQISHGYKFNSYYSGVNIQVNGKWLALTGSEISHWDYNATLKQLLRAGMKPDVHRTDNGVKVMFHSTEATVEQATENEVLIAELKLEEPIVTGSGSDGLEE